MTNPYHPLEEAVGLARERVVLDGSQVRLRVRANGWVMLAALLVLGFGTLNFGLNLGLLFTLWMAGLWLLAAPLTRRNLAGLRIRAQPGAAVFAGSQARFRLSLESPGAGRQRVIQIAPQAGLAGDFSAPGRVAGADPLILTLRAPARRRGWLRLEGFRLFSESPLGLFAAAGEAALPMACLVYPRPEPEGPPLPVSPWEEARPDRHSAASDAFSGLRAYRPGDPIKTIHWKRSAQQEQLLVKQFEQDGATRLLLDWEALAPMETEARLARLCRWVLQADAAGLAYELQMPAGRVGPHRGADHRRQCLKALALHGSDEPAPGGRRR